MRCRTIPEIAELRHFSLGDGIFLQSFVLRHFSIVQESEAPEGQLESKLAPGFESLLNEGEQPSAGIGSNSPSGFSCDHEGHFGISGTRTLRAGRGCKLIELNCI